MIWPHHTALCLRLCGDLEGSDQTHLWRSSSIPSKRTNSGPAAHSQRTHLMPHIGCLPPVPSSGIVIKPSQIFWIEYNIFFVHKTLKWDRNAQRNVDIYPQLRMFWLISKLSTQIFLWRIWFWQDDDFCECYLVRFFDQLFKIDTFFIQA